MKKPARSHFPAYAGLGIILSSLVFLAGDRDTDLPPSRTLTAGHAHWEGSHADPQSEHRMAVFHYNQGNQAFRKGDYADAERQYRMALHHDPDLAPAQVNLSTLYLKTRRFTQAGDLLARLFRGAPALPETHYNLACYYALTGKPEEGFKALKEAVRLGYRNPREARTDPDLEAVRRLPEFEAWVQSLEPDSGSG